VEIWRAGAIAAQLPARHGDFLEHAYITDNWPVTVRLQFDPSSQGRVIILRAGKGVILDPPMEILHIGPTGECVLTVSMDESVAHSHISFHCEGLMTTLPLSRSSLAFAQAKESATPEGAR